MPPHNLHDSQNHSRAQHHSKEHPLSDDRFHVMLRFVLPQKFSNWNTWTFIFPSKRYKLFLISFFFSCCSLYLTFLLYLALNIGNVSPCFVYPFVLQCFWHILEQLFKGNKRKWWNSYSYITYKRKYISKGVNLMFCSLWFLVVLC